MEATEGIKCEWFEHYPRGLPRWHLTTYTRISYGRQPAPPHPPAQSFRNTTKQGAMNRPHQRKGHAHAPNSKRQDPAGELPCQGLEQGVRTGVDGPPQLAILSPSEIGNPFPHCGGMCLRGLVRPTLHLTAWSPQLVPPIYHEGSRCPRCSANMDVWYR
jgi:hypothetical protein